jgi:hypothetical protein
MRRQTVRALVPVLVGLVFAALPVVRAGAITSAADDDESDPGVPESTIAPPETDPEEPEPPPTDDEPVEEDDGQNALAIALGIAGLAVLVIVAGRWMIHHSDLDDVPGGSEPPGWREGDVL